jgi:phage tail-like protein
MPDLQPGQSLRFRVRIDGEHDLGSWSKCDGLSVEYEVKEYMEGGENTYVHRIPGRVKYPNIKLTRLINKDSSKVATWVAGLRDKVERRTAEIAALDPKGETIVSWNLDGVYPVRWTGPSFDIGSSSAATETLELAHNGFLD